MPFFDAFPKATQGVKTILVKSIMTMTMLTIKSDDGVKLLSVSVYFGGSLAVIAEKQSPAISSLQTSQSGKYQSYVSSTFSEVIISFLFIGQEDKRYPNDLRHVVRSECFSSPLQIWRFREFGQLFWKRGRLIVWFLLN